MSASPRRTLVATAWLHGQLADEVRCETGRMLEIGPNGRLGVPCPAGSPFLVRAEWTPGGDVHLRDGRGEQASLTVDEEVRYRVGPVEVSLRLAPTRWLRRTAPFAWAASLSWFMVVMASTLVVQQVGVVYEHRCDWFGIDCAMQVGGLDWDAQLIARLAERDFGGQVEQRQRVVVAAEPEDVELPDRYMPAGDEGPSDQLGGAENVSRDPVRQVGGRKPAPGASEAPVIDDEVTAPDGAPMRDEASSEAPGRPDDLGVDEVDDAQDEAEVRSEDTRGWGIRDWLDMTPERRAALEAEVMKELARERLRIDPDNPDALSLLAYYQYLSEDYEDAADTYDKLLSVDPESAAAYNNKALVYKRMGQYAEEEGLYRVALSLDPDDTTAMNNLAVNLAHQGRYDEALAIMAELETMLPGDPYSDLHRAKIHAARGDDDKALAYLDKALQGMAQLDTLHHIEFRQDIRIDPAFDKLRQDAKFRGILTTYYGEDSPLGGSP